MTRNRAAALVVLVVVFLAVLAAVLAGPRDVAATFPSASPTTTASTAAPTPNVSPTTTAAIAVATPLTSARYSSPLGYSIDLPVPWHRSSCAVLTQQSPDPIGEEFVPVSVRDETGTDIGPQYSTLRVLAEANPQNISPRQWAEQGKTIGGQAGERTEDVTYAGRPAARKTIPGTPLASYFVADRGRMIVVNPNVRFPIDAAVEQAMGRIVGSFAFLTDAERAAAHAALPTAGPPRTPEQLADGLAAAFAAKNVDTIAALSAPCITTGGENAGGTTVSRERYLDDLRTAFAAGLVVTVRSRPIDSAFGIMTIGSTWQDSRGTKER